MVDESDSETVKETRKRLEELIESQINKWQTSWDVVYMPEDPVRRKGVIMFGAGPFTSVLKKDASVGIKRMLTEGDLFVGVSKKGLSEKYLVGPFSFNDESGKKRVIGAIFPFNFYQRCEDDGTKPDQVMDSVFARIIYWDAKLQSEGKTLDGIETRDGRYVRTCDVSFNTS